MQQVKAPVTNKQIVKKIKRRLFIKTSALLAERPKRREPKPFLVQVQPASTLVLAADSGC